MSTPIVLGQTVMTAAVDQWMNGSDGGSLSRYEFVVTCLRLHQLGSDGDVDAHDKRVNAAARRNGDRVLSSYALLADDDAPDDHLWVITEGDRSVTTILFPSDY